MLFRVPVNLKRYIQPLKDYCHRAIRSYDGCSNWYELSYENEWEDCEGNQEVAFKKGKKYEDLLQIFKNDIPYSKILLESPVSRIDYTDTDDIQILIQNGTVISADVVIFTGSLGILKAKGRDLFEPTLPDDKLKAIDTIGFGIVDKIYLEFSEPILNSDTNWNYFLFNDEGITYSDADAANDWTRFLFASYVIDDKLTSFWLSGKN